MRELSWSLLIMVWFTFDDDSVILLDIECDYPSARRIVFFGGQLARLSAGSSTVVAGHLNVLAYRAV